MNLHTPDTGRWAELNELFSCLAHRDRRRVLGALHGGASENTAAQRTTVEELVRALPSRGTRQRKNGQRTMVKLEHVHLPKLEDVGLVEWNRELGVVGGVDHAAFRDTNVVDVVTGRTPVAADSLDALLCSLADGRRRLVLDVLSQHADPVAVETLSKKVHVAEQATDAGSSPDTDREVRTSLHHKHLPKLADAELVTYDTAAETVEYEGHPLLDDEAALSSLVLSSNPS